MAGAPGTTSKNQRAGVVKRPRIVRNAAGQELERVLIVPVKGRRRLEWRVKQ